MGYKHCCFGQLRNAETKLHSGVQVMAVVTRTAARSRKKKKHLTQRGNKQSIRPLCRDDSRSLLSPGCESNCKPKDMVVVVLPCCHAARQILLASFQTTPKMVAHASWLGWAAHQEDDRPRFTGLTSVRELAGSSCRPQAKEPLLARPGSLTLPQPPCRARPETSASLSPGQLSAGIIACTCSVQNRRCQRASLAPALRAGLACMRALPPIAAERVHLRDTPQRRPPGGCAACAAARTHVSESRVTEDLAEAGALKGAAS